MKPASSATRKALQSPRSKAVQFDTGVYIDGQGYLGKHASTALPSEQHEKLRHTFGLTSSQLEGLANDTGVIAAVWHFSAPTTDVFSSLDIQQAVRATLQFIRRLDALTDEHKLALAPVIQHLNPTWSDPANWQLQQALELMRPLSDQKGRGAKKVDESRTVEAVDGLLASWEQHTGLRLSKGAKRVTAPLRFYRALLPLLRVNHPRNLFTGTPTEMSKAELEAFRAAVDRAFPRRADHWMKNRGK